MPLRGNRRTSTKVPGLEETSPILHVNGSSKGDQDVETSDELTNAVTGLPVLSNCTVTQHMQNVPNTRLHQVVLRTPFILTYEQRDTLTRVVKKLWWNCRLLSRFMRENTHTTFTPSSLEKLKVKQIREQLKPVMAQEHYYCDQCTKSFQLFLGIWNHMKSIHKIEVKPTRKVQGQIRGTYNMRNRYTTLKDYYEAHDNRK
ncbi:hypothetical protein M8J75_002813 [Diaphorina citri]|nr:hypothetical protein M8J75_002813 [Diaphorina citri]KAI5731302.1 hypothetical protein M8J77_007857 [Diaphorina citri]